MACQRQQIVVSATTESKFEIEVVPQMVVPSNSIQKSKLKYHRNNSKWTLDGNVYSGLVETYYPNKTLKEKFGILKGKKQGVEKHYFPDGHLAKLSHYHQGKLHGEKKVWSADAAHVILSHLNYHLGKVHGVQKKWYPTGELFKLLHVNMGAEEGLQQAFRKNGDLFANYEARDGKIYGLRKSALCFELDDEKVQYDD